MKKAKTLRIYVSNTDIVKHSSVYETLAFEAQKYGLAGTTIFKGMMGFGASSKLHSNKFWETMDKFPVVVEIIDEDEKIDAFLEKILPWLNMLPKGCLVTCQDTTVVLAKKGVK